MATEKKKSLTPSWYRNVLSVCETFAADYETTQLETLDTCLAQVLGTLVGTHQIPDDRLKSTLARIKKIKAGEKTAESVAILTKHYKNVISASTAQ